MSLSALGSYQAVGDGDSLFTNELMYGGTIASCGGEEYPVVIETEKLGLMMGWNAQYGAVEWKEGGEK